MALPQDGQNANALATVKEVPIGKKLIFVDPDTNEGGIITLEDLTTQILKKLTSQTFALDQGTKTLPAALNELNSKQTLGEISPFYGNIDKINGTSIRIATSQSSGTLPTKLEGNRYIIITDTHFDESRLIYAVQFAIGFGSSAIAIRNCNFTSVGSGKYSEWRYI